MKKFYLLSAAAVMALGANAQSWHEGDIKWVESTQLASNVSKWKTSHKLTEDDNFFISRVRPRLRFQNTGTQIRENLEWGVNDKRLTAWLPINNNFEGNRNALPTGEFDSECFTMWSYVDHFGNWSCPLGGIPGNFSDVAHKNGVVVSSVAGIPFGGITSAWSSALQQMGNMNAEDAAKMLVYYGHDGIGYNSEFSGYYYLANLRTMHQNLITNINKFYSEAVPGYDMAENMWYDGTNDNGSISFDQGLAGHNIKTWGPLGEERTSLFLNYNWNRPTTMTRSVENAASQSYGKGRNPLYLYCGINMQGGEPRGTSWPLLTDVNLSIGLWGAHSENMFWQHRGEDGSTVQAKQNTYQGRLENWFTGGTRNPANCPVPKSVTSLNSHDKEFQGMSYFMSARSAMKWDLSEAPFYSFFNIGNGCFFNWKGVRANGSEWYNIGVQDYMPTWRWWLTSKFLGKESSDVPESGVKASFTWDDAYVGGSCLRVNGTTDEEYLHLFKTSYALQAGDVITFRYKLVAGRGNVDVVLSVDGKESEIAKRINVCTTEQMFDDGEWVSKTYTVDNGDGLAGETLAMVALGFKDAAAMDLYAGEFSIKRGQSPAPVKPEAPVVTILRNTYAGVDAKLIFNVPNNKPAGEVCYNDDVNISMFKIYAQEEGEEPILMGITTSWAAMSYSTPFNGDVTGVGNIRFGVSSLSLDTDTESEIAWSDYKESGARIYSDAIQTSKTTLTPNEEFTLSTVDEKREFQWSIYPNGDHTTAIAQSSDMTNSWTCNGLSEIGTYDLVLVGPNNESSAADATITHAGYIVVTDAARGRIPEIQSITANGKEADIEVMTGSKINFAYTGRTADGSASRGIAINEQFFGVRVDQVLDLESQAFSVAGWLKIDNFPGAVNFVDVVERDGSWPRNNWGWLWSSINADGTIQNYDQDYSAGDAGATTNVLRYDFGNGTTKVFNKGQWTHFAMIFDRDATKARTQLYINGKKVESTWKYYRCTDYDNNMTMLQQGNTDDYVNAYKRLKASNLIIVGGNRHTGRGHGGNGLVGVLDEFQVWGKAMTAEEVKASMDGLDPEALPEGLAAYWDFEDTPNGENKYIAKGTKAGAEAGYFQLNPTTKEGQSVIGWIRPVEGAGCPFIEGSNYKITTTPSWKARLGEISDVTGSDTEGSAKISFPREGQDYTAVLTLTNDLGSHSRTFQFIKVGNSSGIDGVENDGELKAYTVDDALFLDVVADGNYSVSVYDLNGRTIASKTQEVAAGSYMRVTLNGASGVYVVNVLRDGVKAKSFKVIKK